MVFQSKSLSFRRREYFFWNIKLSSPWINSRVSLDGRMRLSQLNSLFICNFFHNACATGHLTKKCSICLLIASSYDCCLCFLRDKSSEHHLHSSPQSLNLSTQSQNVCIFSKQPGCLNICLFSICSSQQFFIFFLCSTLCIRLFFLSFTQK